MSKPKKNNTAYKQTPIGLIPNEWEVKWLTIAVDLKNEYLKDSQLIFFKLNLI